MRHQYNPEAETFVLDMTEELKEMVDKGTGFISIEVTKEASLESDLGGKDLPIGFMSRESGAPPLMQIQRLPG